MKFSLAACGLAAVLLLSEFAAATFADDAEVGEFSIPAVSPLDAESLRRLRELIRTDPEARTLAERVAAEAEPLLDDEPRPLTEIHYEGLVNTDPKRLATVEKLSQTADVARLVRSWQASGDERAGETLRRWIGAWTAAYRPTGNDVNENKLYPLLVAYDATRAAFDDAERTRIDAWVARFGENHAQAVKTSKHFTNRYSKHVRLLAICGRILSREAWTAEAREGVRRFVSESLHADGTSEDLVRRDTLTYHASALVPVIELAALAGDDGPALYDWKSPSGASIRRSVDYVAPYATGEKTREEWTASKVELDRRRAASGLEKYRPGRPFDPRDALALMEAASRFDPALLAVVRKLSGSSAERFPTWQTLLNHALAPPARRD